MIDDRMIRAGAVADALERAAGRHVDGQAEIRAFLEAHDVAHLITMPTLGAFHARKIRKAEKHLRELRSTFDNDAERFGFVPPHGHWHRGVV